MTLSEEKARFASCVLGTSAAVGEWMWENRNSYTGLSVLPHDGGTYKQAPFEECSKERYEALMASLKDVDLTKISETEDMTDLTAEAACSGGSCEVKYL